ncbi:MAG: hypothetical protein WAX80_01200 [Minisyncoccia bacterium]
MKKFFVYWFVASIILAIITSGCAGRKFYFFPVVQVQIINDCPGATLTVESVQGDKIILAHGEQDLMILEPGSNRADNQKVLTARGVDGTGRYLGSDTRTFYVGQGGAREDHWQVRYLTGGLGCEQVRR